MATLLGTSTAGFITVTLLVMGFTAFMTGQGLANTWQPAWRCVAYGLLLGMFDRFLVYTLFEGRLLSIPGFLVDTALIVVVCIAAYRVTTANKMVRQYPWLYERTGLFTWQDK